VTLGRRQQRKLYQVLLPRHRHLEAFLGRNQMVMIVGDNIGLHP
jgi:hypothetical protein